MTNGGAREKPNTRGLLILGGVLFLASAYFYQDPGWNGNSRLDLTRAIVEQGTLAIDSYQLQPEWDTGDKAFYNGHYYSDKAIGSSLLAAPFYYVLYRAATALGLVLGSAITKHILTTTIVGSAFTVGSLAMYLVALKITGNAWKALIPTLGLSFGTMLWPYSAVFYGHVLTAAFLAVAFFLLFTVSEAEGADPDLRLFVTGLALGLAFMTEYTAALIIAGLIVYAAYALRRRGLGGIARGAILGSAGAVLPLAAVLCYNVSVYGSPLATGYAYEVEDRFLEGMSSGIMGMHLPNLTTLYHITIDPQFGILWQSPILLLAPIGYFIALRHSRFRAVGMLSLYSVLVMLAMNGGYYLWWGGSAFGPRLMIPGLPFLIVPLAVLPDAVLWVTGAAGIISSAQMLIPLMGQIQYTLLVYRVHRGMFYVADAPFTGFSLLYDYGLPQVLRQYAAGQPAWTLGAALGIPYWISVPILVVAEAALILRFRSVTTPTTAAPTGSASGAERRPTDRPKSSRS